MTLAMELAVVSALGLAWLAVRRVDRIFQVRIRDADLAVLLFGRWTWVSVPWSDVARVEVCGRLCLRALTPRTTWVATHPARRVVLVHRRGGGLVALTPPDPERFVDELRRRAGEAAHPA